VLNCNLIVLRPLPGQTDALVWGGSSRAPALCVQMSSEDRHHREAKLRREIAQLVIDGP
jgi:hypothetical protein